MVLKTKPPFSQNLTVLDLLNAQANFQGDKIFAYFPQEEPVTFSMMDHLSDRLASHIKKKKLGKQSKVVLVFPPGINQIISLIACWKLGLIVSPVDRFISAKGFKNIIDVLKPQLVMIDPSLENRKGIEKQVDRKKCQYIEANISKLPDGHFSDERVRPDDVGLILFTSGSTGLPKGVQLTHRTLVNGALNLCKAKDIEKKDRVLCVLPLSHMNGLITTFMAPLLSGSSVVYMQKPFNTRQALKLIDEYDCTWFSATPTHYSMMMFPPVDKRFWKLEKLRFCRSASAPLSPRILNQFEAHYGVPIIETMGTTETAGQIFSN